MLTWFAQPGRKAPKAAAARNQAASSGQPGGPVSRSQAASATSRPAAAPTPAVHSTDPSSPQARTQPSPERTSSAATVNSPKKPARGGTPASESRTSASPSARAGSLLPRPAIRDRGASEAPARRGPAVAPTSHGSSRKSA